MQTDFDPAARQRLVDTIESLGELYRDDVDNPVVSLDEFFVGNRDLGSIGCNLMRHPGLDTFHQTLKKISARPDVSGVYVRISAIDDDLAWPFSDTIYINTSADTDEVRSWVDALSPSEVAALDDISLLHPATPRPPAGQRMHLVWWD